MAKMMFTTVYDDVLSKIETMTRSNFDNDAYRTSKLIRVKNQIIDQKYGNIDIFLTNETIVGEYNRMLVQNGKTALTNDERISLVNEMLFKGVLFTAQDIMIYRILLSHYINYQQNGIATITLDKMHNEYRGKTPGGRNCSCRIIDIIIVHRNDSLVEANEKKGFI